MILVALLLLSGCEQETPPDFLTSIPLSGLDATVSEHIQEHIDHVRSKPQSGARTGQLAMILHSYGFTEVAESLYLKAQELQPDEFQWAYLHAVSLQDLSNNQEALEEFQALDQRRPNYLPNQLRIGDLLGQNNQIDQGVELYSELALDNPDQAVVHYGYGQALDLKGESELALNAFKRAVYLKANYRAAHYSLAKSYRQLGQPEEAAKHAAIFESLEQQSPIVYDPYMSAVKALARTEANAFNSALKALKRGDIGEAIKQFELVVKFNPKSHSAHANLIGLYADTDRYDKSEEHFELAKLIEPNNTKLYNNIGSARVRNEQYELAKQAFEQAIDLDPNYAIAWRNLGRVSQQLDDPRGAAAAYKKSLEIDPIDRQTLLFFAQFNLASGNLTEAIPLLEQTVVIADAKTPHYYRVLAQAYSIANRADDAREALDKAQTMARRGQQRDLLLKIHSDIEVLDANGILTIELGSE